MKEDENVKAKMLSKRYSLSLIYNESLHSFRLIKKGVNTTL